MTSSCIHERNGERPRGIAVLAVLFALASLALSTYAALVAMGSISFMQAAWLMGQGAARMGPAAIGIAAVLYALTAIGLYRFNRFARWSAIVLIGYGLLEDAPALLSALTTFVPTQLALAAANVLLRTIALWYLFQPPVREAFE